MNKKIYKVAIIGLGKAGFIYSVKKDKFFSHSEAITKNKRLKLIAGVDINKNRLKSFEKKYNLRGYFSLNKLINSENFDIVIISVPTDKQFIVIKDLLKLIKNKTVLCEKPCTMNLKQINFIYKMSKIKKIKFYVNFQRNSLKSSHVIKKIVSKEKLAIINVTYSQGVLNSASHYISLFLSFFSNNYLDLIKQRNYKSKIKDDFLSKFKINYKKVQINFKPKTNYKKIHGAFEVIGQKFSIKYLFGGRKVLIKNNFSRKIIKIKSDIQNSQLFVYNELINSLDGKKNTLCSIYNAIEAFKIIKKIK